MFYFMIFYLCSVLGLIIETAYSFVIRRRFTSRRTMVLSPVCTVYGFGGLAIYLVAQHFNTIVAILLGTLFAIVIEYVYGMVCKDYFGIILWDYSECKFNLHGQICLEYSGMWLLLCAIFVLFLEKPIAFFAVNFPPLLAFLLFSMFVVDVIISVQFIKNGVINRYCPVIKYSKIYGLFTNSNKI